MYRRPSPTPGDLGRRPGPRRPPVRAMALGWVTRWAWARASPWATRAGWGVQALTAPGEAEVPRRSGRRESPGPDCRPLSQRARSGAERPFRRMTRRRRRAQRWPPPRPEGPALVAPGSACRIKSCQRTAKYCTAKSRVYRLVASRFAVASPNSLIWEDGGRRRATRESRSWPALWT